jgi:hypothetical protein
MCNTAAESKSFVPYEGVSKMPFPVFIFFRIEFLFPLSESDSPNVRNSHSPHWRVRSIAACQNVTLRPPPPPPILYFRTSSPFFRLAQTRISNLLSRRFVFEVIFDVDEFRKKNISMTMMEDIIHYWHILSEDSPTSFTLKMWYASLKRSFFPLYL